MATSPMTITTNNIIIGPCTSFTVDGNAVGATDGGVTLTVKETLTSIAIDQATADVVDAVKSVEATVKTTLSEATLQNLAIAMDMPAPVVGTSPANLTLSLAMNTGKKKEHALVFVGPAAGTYANRTYTCPKAVSIVSVDETVMKDKQKGYVVEWKLHPDLTNLTAPFGTVVDQ
ncbi:hypothetical protein [Alicyclobacillus fastidiosus]|uniref:Major tail protein n=1 Tax=Alicyclobacillus fastidiosus TaxID=392011 RepID=A0ABV5AK48_9BACL|nr:hypothetical protein [Alicyclobacillus fastidiosus]WEH09267.1 hypothetical protein PYS47_21760 [Alicyclobacillus fastidiosus]